MRKIQLLTINFVIVVISLASCTNSKYVQEIQNDNISITPYSIDATDLPYGASTMTIEYPTGTKATDNLTQLPILNDDIRINGNQPLSKLLDKGDNILFWHKGLIWVSNIERTKITPLFKTDDINFKISPNLQYVLFRYDASQLWLLELRNGKKQQIYFDNMIRNEQVSTKAIGYFNWSFDSQFVIFSAEPGYDFGASRAYIYSISNKQSQYFTIPDGSSIWDVAWGTHSEQIFFVYSPGAHIKIGIGMAEIECVKGNIECTTSNIQPLGNIKFFDDVAQLDLGEFRNCFENYNPSISPNGQLLAFWGQTTNIDNISNNNNSLCIYNLESQKINLSVSEIPQPFCCGEITNHFGTPNLEWSHDGEKLAYTVLTEEPSPNMKGDIFFFDMNQQTFFNWTNTPNENEIFVSWVYNP